MDIHHDKPKSRWSLTYVRPPSPLVEMEPDEIRGPLDFYIGHRRIALTRADRLDPRRFVYRVQVAAPSFLDWIPIPTLRLAIRHLLNICPWLRTFRPEWFLPPTCILKRQKPDWEEEFNNDKRAYHVLEPLQGIVVPYLYGEVTYNNYPAILLSEIHGTRLDHLCMLPNANDDNLEGKLELALGELTKYGVEHADLVLHNLFVVEKRVMIIDFEQVRFGMTTVWEESMNKANIGSIMWDFEFCQRGDAFIQEEKERYETEIRRRTPITQSGGGY